MQKPVAMPIGGIRILRTVTAVRPSRMRQAITATNPTIELINEIAGDSTITMALTHPASHVGRYMPGSPALCLCAASLQTGAALHQGKRGTAQNVNGSRPSLPRRSAAISTELSHILALELFSPGRELLGWLRQRNGLKLDAGHTEPNRNIKALKRCGKCAIASSRGEFAYVTPNWSPRAYSGPRPT